MAKRVLDDYISEPYSRIPLSQIVPDAANVRQHYTKKELESLAQSLANEGQIEPAVAEKVGQQYRLVVGHRRYYSSLLALQRGWTSCDYLIVDVAQRLPKELRLKIQIEENDMKEKVPPQNVAESLWGRYQISLAQAFKDPGAVAAIHRAETYWDIPEDLRARLSIPQYAYMMKRDPSTVRRAFQYQKLHGNIKQMVESQHLSYYAACELAAIPIKSEQRRLLSENNVKTSKAMKPLVKGYLKSMQENSGADFLKIDTQNGRTKLVKDLGYFIKEAEHTLRTLARVIEIDSGIWSMSIKRGDEKINPGTVIEHAKSSITRHHAQFMRDEWYRKRWEYSPKRMSLAELVRDYDQKAGEHGVIMETAKSKIVSLDDIALNPLNPRGSPKSFNEEGIERLSMSIKEVGLIHALVLMQAKKGYVTLCGHRRYLAAKKAGLRKVRAVILPELTEKEQLILMYDEDIFEQVNIHERSRGIARQFELEKKKHHGKYDVNRFAKEHKRWDPSLVRDALAYDSLAPEIQGLYLEGLVTYRVAIDIAQLPDAESQKDFALAAAITRHSHKDIQKEIREIDGRQGTIIPREILQADKRHGERRKLLEQLNDYFYAVAEHLKALKPRDTQCFLQDYHSTHRFQNLVKLLEQVSLKN